MTGIEFDKYTQLHLWCLLTNDLVFPRISAPLTMTFQFMSTSRLLDNAVAAIRVGIEDFSDGSEGRLLSSVRNVTSGLLLLYKEVLRRMSPENDPELLIKQNLRPVIDDGELILRATGKKTINVETIISRLKDCGVGLDDEKKKLLKTVISTRNEVEHYYVEFTSVKIEQLLGKEFLLVYDVVCRLLKENPMGLFGEECWESLLGIKDVYCEQKKFCTESYELVNWKFDVVKDSLCELTCPECGSDLVKAVSNGSVFPSINMRCTLCSHEFCFSSVLAKCFSEHMEQISTAVFMDCGGTLNETCCECLEDTFLVEERTCVNCGYQLEHKECFICSESLGIDDQQNDGLCSYHAWRRDKEGIVSKIRPPEPA